MSAKDLIPGSGGYHMAKSMYGFSVDEFPDLETAADAAVKRIYTAGLMICNGRVGPGGNNVMANFAAQAFSTEQLDTLRASTNPYAKDFCEIIELRLEFADGKGGQQHLEQIYKNVQVLKGKGWNPGGEPHRLNGPRPV